jgi:copper chaperone CopZ
MKQAKFDIPVLFGDHHVLEIRRILSEVEGVKDIFISSAYNFLKIEYDESATSEEAIKTLLEEAGYYGDLGFEFEQFGLEPGSGDHKKHFRKGVLYDQTGQTQGFTQKATKTSREDWPSPGMGKLEIGKEG